MSTESDNTRAAVADLLAGAIIEFSARHKGQTTRPASWGAPFKMRGSGHVRYCSDPATTGLRKRGYADEFVRHIRHTGWYADMDGDNTYRGVVYLLPGRDGMTRALAGYEESDNPDAAVLDLSQIHEAADGDDASREAARTADQLAEWAAMEEREWNTAWHAGSRWNDLGDEIQEVRDEVRQLIAEYRDLRQTKTGSILARYQALINVARRKRTALQKQRATLACGADDRYCFHRGDANLRAAFNEGAGRRVL